MKVRALWGFVGDADLLKADSAKVKRGEVFDDVNDEYAHVLIGKGLAEEVGGKTTPKANKQAKPEENK
ncbi:hypothetical protein LCH33_004604 [Pseudomonas amygdali]|uniref:Uncharacterized protein n=3 Tax=Pseudomonas syringae group TaxID=136849 RepID=F3FBV9_PSESX|nr:MULTISPECIES: hypothetical protein [Pseudomonas syringae group]EGH27695.1 hypothetical protein PSYJA_01129 [Pseudomonas syringae pv. japonica str. M301072]AVX22819.1 hypothetical protein DA456_05125 [Pseudomonas syringae pv. atrofaciens]KPX51894.1 Uncharacterized protein ALO67_03769 [Pseudomonas amygdali pv. hibisci]MCF5649503.1 hypothetical protein [Pseudomonas syringae]POD54919.1 hypothetical protein BKM15_07260 [Pseudomonas syringae pv. syringae]